MSLRRVVVAGALVGLACHLLVPLAAAQEGLADVVERCEQAVVKIEVQGSGGASHLGSGFVIDENGTLVTNLHVLVGAQKAVATFPNGTQCEIRGTLFLDKSRDICIARIDGSGFSKLTVATQLPRKGDRVTALGSPQGLSFSATTGIVSAIRPATELGPEIERPEMKGTWIQVDAALSGGNSGGPLINDRGEVVGMSTLASQGAAQNLNFGISGADILQAYTASSGQPLVALPQGVGKMESDKRSSNVLARPDIPQQDLQRYVTDCRTMFKDLLRDMKQELTRSSGLMREMRKGNPYLPPNSPPTADVVRMIDTRRKKTTYFFRDENVKDRELTKLKDRIRDLELIDKTVSDSDANNKDALYKLLSKFGPRLDTRRKGSIGLMSEAIVLLAFNENGVIILYDKTPYLLWVETATGLSEGSELTPLAVYVAGTQTVKVPDQPPRVVTVLHCVTDEELRGAIFGDAAKLAGSEWRTWKDTSGKFQIEAMLVEATATEVVLKKRDGSTIKVPLLRLSTSDREFLRQ